MPFMAELVGICFKPNEENAINRHQHNAEVATLMAYIFKLNSADNTVPVLVVKLPQSIQVGFIKRLNRRRGWMPSGHVSKSTWLGTNDVLHVKIVVTKTELCAR